MSNAIPPPPIACRQCGGRMITGGACPTCGWLDWLGQALFVPEREVADRLIDRALTSQSGTAPGGSWTPAKVTSSSPAKQGLASVPQAGPASAANPQRSAGGTIRPPDTPRIDWSETPEPRPVASPPTERTTARALDYSNAPRSREILTPPSKVAVPGRPAAPRRSANKRLLAVRGRVKRFLPPVRLVWLFLGIILWNGGAFVGRSVAEPLLLLPIVAVGADLAFQAVRFPRLRFPDAAIANGLFLSVILWPTSFSLALASVAIVTIGLRHLARVASHPVLNPAAAGVVLAAAVFALPQPWHVGSTLRDAELVALLGVILWTKATHTWRILVPYFATNIALSVFVAYRLAGVSAVPLVVQATVLGASTVFYGFFMVSEPRTAPSARPAMLLFGTVVGAAAALLPTLFAEYPMISALGVLAPYLALFVGNALTVVLPSARGIRRPAAQPSKSARSSVAPRVVAD